VNIDDTIVVNGTSYTVTDKETRSPGPGEVTVSLYLNTENYARVLSWNDAHTVETVWIHDRGMDPMTDGTEVETIEYRE
jgi:hypothetical protein